MTARLRPAQRRFVRLVTRRQYLRRTVPLSPFLCEAFVRERDPTPLSNVYVACAPSPARRLRLRQHGPGVRIPVCPGCACRGRRRRRGPWRARPRERPRLLLAALQSREQRRATLDAAASRTAGGVLRDDRRGVAHNADRVRRRAVDRGFERRAVRRRCRDSRRIDPLALPRPPAHGQRAPEAAALARPTASRHAPGRILRIAGRAPRPPATRPG